jgi:hypothetical protein
MSLCSPYNAVVGYYPVLYKYYKTLVYKTKLVQYTDTPKTHRAMAQVSGLGSTTETGAPTARRVQLYIVQGASAMLHLPVCLPACLHASSPTFDFPLPLLPVLLAPGKAKAKAEAKKSLSMLDASWCSMDAGREL